MYLGGEFPTEVLTERKTRLEATITALEKERADLTMQLETATLRDDQIETVADFAREVSQKLGVAEESFDARRRIIDLPDVQLTLAIEAGQKIAYVKCLVDEGELSIESTNS